MKKIIPVFTVFIMIVACVFVISVNSQAKVRISKKNLKMSVSEKVTLRLKGVKYKVNWKSSKPRVAKVSNKGKVTALKKGKTTITANIKKKRYSCVVVVNDKKEKAVAATNDVKNEVTANSPVTSHNSNTPSPTQYAASEPTKTPKPTPKPTKRPSEDMDIPSAKPEPSMEPCYPAVQCMGVFWECFVSDIGDNYIEIVDKNGVFVYRFSYDSSPTDVYYNGKISQNDPMRHSVDIKGDKMKYSDIRTGDRVDIVYDYWEYYSLSAPKGCYAINVYKRTESNTQPSDPGLPGCYPTVLDEGVFYSYYVSDIGEDYIEITDKESGVTLYWFRFLIDRESLKVVCNGKIINKSSLKYHSSYTFEGDNMDYEDIQIGDMVDILYNYWPHSTTWYEQMVCLAINVHRN